MDNMRDIKTRLQAELKQWFLKQCQNNYADFYLYYLPAAGDHAGNLRIAENIEPGYLLAMTERIDKSITVEQNFNKIMVYGILNRLPILTIKGRS